MAELKATKAKRFNASATSALPKLSHKRLNFQETTYSIANRKSQLIESNLVSKEGSWPGNGVDNDAEKLKYAKTMKTEKMPEMNENLRAMSNSSLDSVSQFKHLSHIPILSRFQTNSQKPGSVKKKAAKSETCAPKKSNFDHNERKELTVQIRRTSNSFFGNSRFQSPLQKENRKTTSAERVFNCRTSLNYNEIKKSNKVKETRNIKQCAFSQKNSTLENSENIKRNNVIFAQSYATIMSSSPRHGQSDLSDSFAYEVPEHIQDSENQDSTFDCNLQMDLIISEKSSKSLNSFSQSPVALLDLQDRDSESGKCRKLHESSQSSVPKLYEECKIRTHPTTIRTLSDKESLPSSSSEFDIENEPKSEVTDVNLIQDDDTFRKIHVTEDDANEYDSEAITDTDFSVKSKCTKSETDFKGKETENPKTYGEGKEPKKHTNWRNRQNELLTDVNYRQFVYHPTVLRRQGKEDSQYRNKYRKKSIGGRCSYESKDGSRMKEDRSNHWSKINFKKNSSQTFVSNRDVNISPLRPWIDKLPRSEKQMIDRLYLMQNSDNAVIDIKRESSWRKRLAGTVLRITARAIHILAILNLWPGDNCQLLTSRPIQCRR